MMIFSSLMFSKAIATPPETFSPALLFREMRRKRGGNEGERKTKWLRLDVETKRKRGRIIYKRWDTPRLLLHLEHFPALPPLMLRSPSIHSQESERLEMLNSDLKAQIEELKLERQQLILLLNRHRPTCIVRTDSVKTPEGEANPLLQQLEAKWRFDIFSRVYSWEEAPD